MSNRMRITVEEGRMMSNRMRITVPILICCMVLTISSVGAQSGLFYEPFSDTIDAGVWSNQNGSVIDIGGGDYAWHAGDGASGNNSIISVNTFDRGDNIRVTFTCWHNTQSGGSENAFGIMGPWRTDNRNDGIYEGIAAGFDWVTPETGTGLNLNTQMGLGWAEQAFFNPSEGWGNTAQQGVRLNESFQQACLAAVDKASAVKIRVWLGDVVGGKPEFSTDGGANWNDMTGEELGGVIDTRGLPADTPISPSLGLNIRWNADSNVVPDDQVSNHIGFGPYYGILFIDDIIVENDSTTFIPVEVSGFLVD